MQLGTEVFCFFLNTILIYSIQNTRIRETGTNDNVFPFSHVYNTKFVLSALLKWGGNDAEVIYI